MHFKYQPNQTHAAGYTGYAPYGYAMERRPPRFEIVQAAYLLARPFERQDSLLEQISSAKSPAGADPLDAASHRAHTQRAQVDILLEHLSARHVIHHQIRYEIDYQEGRLRCRLEEIKPGPTLGGPGDKFESDLLKQMDRLSSERRAENIACWRDTGRILSDICDRWTEYADQDRKKRLMSFDL